MDVVVPADRVLQPLRLGEPHDLLDARAHVRLADAAVEIGHEHHGRHLLHQGPVLGLQVRKRRLTGGGRATASRPVAGEDRGQVAEDRLRLQAVQDLDHSSFPPRAAPARLLVHRAHGEPAQRQDRPAVGHDRRRGEQGSGRLVHEGLELVRKSRHGAPDADAADIGAPADSSHPAALADVALHDRPPASQLDDAEGRAVRVTELTLFVVTTAIAALVHGPLEQPARPEHVIEGDRRGAPDILMEEIEQGLGEIVGLHRAARQADDGQPAGRTPGPAEIVRQAHGAGRVALHRMDAAVGGAGADGDDGPGPRRQAVDPVARRDRLPGGRIGPEGGPVALGLVGLVGDRALDHEDERAEGPACPAVEKLDELVADFGGQKRIVQGDARGPGQRAAQQVLDAGLGRAGHRDGVAIAAQTGGEPQDGDLGCRGVGAGWGVPLRWNDGHEETPSRRVGDGSLS